MSDSITEEFLATRDERGFFHFDVVEGGSYIFAPSDDVDDGEAYLVNRETQTTSTVPLRDAFTNSESYPIFLISINDFTRLLEMMDRGELMPVYLS